MYGAGARWLLMYATHSPADWAASLSLGVGVHAALSVPYFLAVDADLVDFDPRPAVRRVLDSGRFDWLLITVTNTRLAARDAGLPRHWRHPLKYRIDGPIPFTITATDRGADIGIERYLVRALFAALFEAADADPEGFGEEFADMHSLAVSAQHGGRDSRARREFDSRMDAYLKEFLGEPAIELYDNGVRQARDAFAEIATGSAS